MWPRKPFHDLHPLPHRRAEVAGADDRIAMEQVVGPDLDPQQAAHQVAHGRQVVVDALEQHVVVVHRHAATKERIADLLRLRRDFSRMVEVRLNPDLARRRQQIDQFLVVEPLRQRDRHARADADHVDVLDARTGCPGRT